ncbi:MAG: ferrous iron transport protein B [Chloroflexi bacterium RBG_16_48_7]|nr:MAG: ferrous iron transport protein B [Chloroflexi bacterium RBG_16_48_7]
MLNSLEKKNITVALAGAPNVGKSTVFNLLTGLSQHVGNWPGKTVEQKTGTFRHGDILMNVVDLPGTYSLTANSAEEQIARDYLVKENPDIVVAVLNAASLERNLYLVAELIELAPCMVIALNMVDVAEQQGMKIDPAALSEVLDIPVIPIVANKNRGLNELVEAISHECVQPKKVGKVKHIEYGRDVKKIIDRVEELVPENAAGPYPRHWAAMKLLEGDNQISKLVRERITTSESAKLESYLRENENAAVTIATLRYEWVGRMVSVVQERPPMGQVSISERIDRAATHPIYGLLILLGIMGLLFTFVYSLGIPIQQFLETNIIERGQALISQNLAFLPSWLIGFLNTGLLAGVGTVLTFIPILFFFFIAFSVLEDVGYTARAAFVTDRFMHLLGLHGKSCLPLVLGFGCNVPAVMGTRIIDSRRARLLTILITPLVPCTGRMAVVTLVAAAFFGSLAIVVSIGIVIFSMIILIIIGFILNRFVIKGEPSSLIMELPLYHVPNPKLIFLVTWQSLKAFIKRAGTVILAVSLAVWLLSVIPTGDISTSILAQIGKWLEPLGSLMGLGWQMMVALISSFIAKENTIATLGVLTSGQAVGITDQLHALLTPAAALAFLVIQVLFIPCIATVSAIKTETNGWRWPIFVILVQLVLSFSIAIAVYQVAHLFI